jgi:hypothetical protein
MSCCGQQRAALRASFEAAAVAAAPASPPRLEAPVALAHTAGSATVARGGHTGLTYVFGAGRAALEVDGRDAPALVASGRFAITSR